jgi:hypothetical protein
MLKVTREEDQLSALHCQVKQGSSRNILLDRAPVLLGKV